jgi:hypothetical protein
MIARRFSHSLDLAANGLGGLAEFEGELSLSGTSEGT